MPYRIEIKKPAEKWFKKYPREIQKRFTKKILKLEKDPEKRGKPLSGGLSGYWELYFERKFRIVYTIDKKNEIVYIEGVRHKDEF
ncbi:MAG: type II toxin-antitoxin system RelE/ParE family toxin [Candidatus Aenigmatarchaeota archaeon]